MSHPSLAPNSVSTLLATVGLTLTGISTGIALSYPLISNAHYALKHQGDDVQPASRTPSLNINQRLTLWNRNFKSGLVIPITISVSTAIWATLWFKEKGKLAVLTPNWTWLASGAALQLSILPFSVFAIFPVNNQLIALRKRANKDGDTAAINEQEVEKLFAQWQTLHNVRCGALVGGLVACIGAFLW